MRDSTNESEYIVTRRGGKRMKSTEEGVIHYPKIMAELTNESESDGSSYSKLFLGLVAAVAVIWLATRLW